MGGPEALLVFGMKPSFAQRNAHAEYWGSIRFFLEQATAHSYFAFDDIPIIHTYVFVLIGLSKKKIIQVSKSPAHKQEWPQSTWGIFDPQEIRSSHHREHSPSQLDTLPPEKSLHRELSIFSAKKLNIVVRIVDVVVFSSEEVVSSGSGKNGTSVLHLVNRVGMCDYRL